MSLAKYRMAAVGIWTTVIFLCVVSSAKADIVVDQSFLVNLGFFARFGPNAGIAQSFKQVNDNITGASVRLHENGTGTGSITIGLFTNLPTLGGIQLATGTTANANAGDLVSVSFGNTPVSITPESTYFLVFTGTNGNMGVASSNGSLTGIDSYTRGQAYHSNFNLVPRNDINFQTFAQVNTTVPEPTSTTLFGVVSLVLGGAAALRRRCAGGSDNS